MARAASDHQDGAPAGRPGAALRVLTLTTLYPNAAAPAHGVFVENRLAAFRAMTGAVIEIVAPVPWFPFKGEWAGRYARYGRAPAREVRRGMPVAHPRYVIPPRIGMTWAAAALERCFYRAAKKLIAEGRDFDVIDAHYLYPDGVAAVRAARRLGKPVVVTARGSDVTRLPSFPRQRRMILEALYGADAIVCVAQALKDELVRLGAPAEKISVLRNGVDLDLFRPLDREQARRALNVSGPVIASVGHLIERKGHHFAIEALAALPRASLLIVGEGPEKSALRRLAETTGVAARVRFLGALPHESLAEVYSAADALVLASSHEGWANVLLEAMACGTPVVATPVGAAPDVVATPEAGLIARERSAPAIAEALAALLAAPPSRADTRAYAARFSWGETAAGLGRLFNAVTARREKRRAAQSKPLAPAGAGAGIIVTVDTEESFDWSRFDGGDCRLCPIEDIDRFQSLAASFGVKPLYLLTWPLINDPQSADYFRALAKSGAADLGLHLHQWRTPPLDGFGGEYYSWQSNLPLAVHAEKLATLAAAFERAFGFRARAHRAGRYGIAPENYAALAAVGVELDFSPSPAFDYAARGGPDFSAMSNAPFAMNTASGVVFVTPVCGGRTLRGGRYFLPATMAAPGFTPGRRPFLRNLTAPARLTCEGGGVEDRAALTRRLLADGTPVLTFGLHSTSLTPGANPYARDAAAVDAMLESSRKYFDFVKNDPRLAFLTLDALAERYRKTGS